jgi:hypothetical protein
MDGGVKIVVINKEAYVSLFIWGSIVLDSGGGVVMSIDK